MRPLTLVGLVILAANWGTRADSAGDGTADHVARLVKQLGHEAFAKREAAGKELDAIGEPALDALRGAAAASEDPEIRSRAERLVRVIEGRSRAAVTKKELERLQGAWSLVSYETDGRQIKGEDESHRFVFSGERWASSVGGQLVQGGTVQRIEVQGKLNAIDLLITEGGNVGVTAVSIYAVDGDTLKYLNSDGPRATDFTTKPGDGRRSLVYRRAMHGDPRPPEVRFESAVFSTDLRLPDSPEAVHRVALTCRLADGETGTLTLDPTAPKFDAFGDPAPAGKSAAPVTLVVTLKRVKAEEGRQLFELAGPRLTSRLAFAAYSNTMPQGDGRLLVRDHAGDIRQVIDLSLPQEHFPPCHPGCFPSGTPVRTPDGTTPIDRLSEGDVITTFAADGRPAVAKVTGVFRTRNRLLELRVEGGTLVTTETQPLALVAGGFRAAGELKPGDRVWRWAEGKRKAVAVTAVTAPDREAEVFNLILGEPTGFVAGDFLVRSKPPAPPPRP